MSVIATITIPADAFVLGRAISANPGLDVRFERLVPLGEDALPYFWVHNESLEDIEASLAAAEDIESFTIVDKVDDEVLARVRWNGAAAGFLGALRKSEAVILEGSGSHDIWRFRLRFPDHERLSQCYDRCAELDIPLTLERVHNPGPGTLGESGGGLTDTQRETLVRALEAGYFDVPRETNLVELSRDLGVSDTAVSQRLRRGTKTLLETTLDKGRTERSEEPADRL